MSQRTLFGDNNVVFLSFFYCFVVFLFLVAVPVSIITHLFGILNIPILIRSTVYCSEDIAMADRE